MESENLSLYRNMTSESIAIPSILFELNYDCMLINSSPQALVELLVRSRDVSSIQEEYLSKISPESSGIMIFKIKEFSWTMAQNWNDWGHLNPDQDPQKISDQLQCKVIYFATDDTTNALGYYLFDCGEAIETYEMFDDEVLVYPEDLLSALDPSADDIENINVLMARQNAAIPAVFIQPRSETPGLLCIQTWDLVENPMNEGKAEVLPSAFLDYFCYVELNPGT
jgi:hypothetical protein